MARRRQPDPESDDEILLNGMPEKVREMWFRAKEIRRQKSRQDFKMGMLGRNDGYNPGGVRR